MWDSRSIARKIARIVVGKLPTNILEVNVKIVANFYQQELINYNFSKD
jgi:hypothetical protein